MLRQRAAEAGVSLSALEIEITESALMQSDATATDVLSELRDDGVRVSVDDFGTGYSSLARLQLLPVDVLKIDLEASSIASGVRRRRARWSEVVIAIAHSLELTVIAEGVENREQYAFLERYGCDLYQGYLLSQALSAEDMSLFLDEDPPERRITVDSGARRPRTLTESARVLGGRLDRLLQRRRLLPLRPRGFESSRCRRIQMLAGSTCSFVQRLTEKAGGWR